MQHALVGQIPDHFLAAQTYEDKYTKEVARDLINNYSTVAFQNGDEEPDDIMISVHSVKSLLKAMRRKKSQGKKGSAQRALDSEVKTTMITILAIGTSDQIRIPESFRYRDPLNCCISKTRFVKSPVLKAVIQKSWKRFEERSKLRKCIVPSSLAKHVVLNAELLEIELVAAGGDHEHNVKLLKTDGLLEFMSHAPRESALDRCLEKKLLQVKDAPAQEECQTMAAITDHGPLFGGKITSGAKLPSSNYSRDHGSVFG